MDDPIEVLREGVWVTITDPYALVQPGDILRVGKSRAGRKNIIHVVAPAGTKLPQAGLGRRE